MFTSIFLVSFYLTGFLAAPNEKIIGGRPAKLGEIPYIVSLRYKGWHICGGSILNKRHILTAAHCVNKFLSEPDPSEYQVQYGVIDISSKYNNIVSVKEIFVHEDYLIIPYSFPNDIAILKLDGDILFGPYVKPTVLPTSAPNMFGKNITATLSGWGYTENTIYGVNYLLTVEIPLYDDETCSYYIPPFIPILNILGYDSQIHVCAGDLDNSHGGCYGDSGGPLYAEGVQHGIVSWGSFYCAESNKPGIFTRVASYVDWIRKIINE